MWKIENESKFFVYKMKKIFDIFAEFESSYKNYYLNLNNIPVILIFLSISFFIIVSFLCKVEFDL